MKPLYLWEVELSKGSTLNILTDVKTLRAVETKVKPLISSSGEYYDEEISSLKYQGTIDA